jgi:hypothetical protein
MFESKASRGLKTERTRQYVSISICSDIRRGFETTAKYPLTQGEYTMSRKKGKAVSFDAMVKFFMQRYNIPTKKDVDRLIAKLDRLENLIKTTLTGPAIQLKGQPGQRQPNVTAVDVVFDLIKRSREGLGFADIQAKTGFGDKKIRNIIFRLNKIGKIKRKQRGTYTAV